jgi:hypothetical protein
LDAAIKVSFMGGNLAGLKLWWVMFTKEAFYGVTSAIRRSGELAEVATQ